MILFNTEKKCYCLGDIDVDRYDPWRMTKEKHRAILEVCRNAWVTFHEVKIAKDETGAYNILPIKEQCGVKNPYINAYGELAGTWRNYTYHDTCACVKDPCKNVLYGSIFIYLSIFQWIIVQEQ